jgi:hypothetical protein
MMLRRLLPLLGGLPVLGATGKEPDTLSISFNDHVRPILSDKCYACHGPDPEDRAADLRLDTEEGAFADLGGYRAITPGDPEESEIFWRIESEEEDEIMPPPDSHLSLTEQEKSIIKKWIEQGAKWENHWSFEPIEETKVPSNDSTWPQNEIDEFVLSSLIQKSISPSKPADPETWLRRVSFDLTGLPPSLDRLHKFLQDPSPKAREAEVDYLLSTIDYAERMALLWLDGARYADSNGFQFDTARTMWPWRDWVIQAYSQNMPYDQFVREQVAGDLLPNPTQDQLIATGFNRNHGYTFEGGTIDEEYRVIYANDKTTTFGTLFLGLTLECTRCHDHKYDPLSMEDYYSMFAFFNTSAEKGNPGQESRATKAAAPYLEVYSGRKNTIHANWKQLKPTKAVAEKQTLEIQKDHSVQATGEVPSSDSYVINFAVSPQKIRSLRLEVLPINGSKHGPVGRAPNGNFVLNELEIFLVSENSRTPLKIKEATATFDQFGFHVKQSIDGDSKTGWAVQGGLNKTQIARFEFETELNIPKGSRLEARMEFSSHDKHVLGRFRFASSIWGITPPNALTMIMKEEERETRILMEGLFDQPGKRVTPRTPAVLPPFDGYRLDRLGLVDWLVSKENPLFARVSVNRLWQQFFGYGLVKTPDNFGLQGELPSHPELLDWLAKDFINHKWDLHQTIKKIVLSATYGQSSTHRPELEDPDNRSLSRASSFRLPAEMIRDQALAASGLLSKKVGGPSVMPYQPDGVWADLNAPPSHREFYVQSKGDNLYRKSLYTYWRRAVLHPSMSAFDAPSRDVCTVERASTNTPLQALVTLHDPTYWEAARTLAVLVHGETDPIKSAFERVLSRKPSPKEFQLLSDLQNQRISHYRKDSKSANRTLSVGESPPSSTKMEPAQLAGLTDVCHTLFNLSETITRK